MPAYHDGHVILWQRRQSSAVAALDAKTGELKWTRPLGAEGKDLNRGGLPIADGLVCTNHSGLRDTVLRDSRGYKLSALLVTSSGYLPAGYFTI